MSYSIVFPLQSSYTLARDETSNLKLFLRSACTLLEIVKTRATTYHPQSDRLVAIADPVGCDGRKCTVRIFPPNRGVQNFKEKLWLWLPAAYAKVDHEVLRVDLHANIYVIVLDCTWSRNQKCSVSTVASRLYISYNICTRRVGKRSLQRI